jgi:AraC-like DNA-binding protein
MSDYDNSVSHYAVKLGVSERQVRRYCRSGLIPSAELTKGRTGRPKWRINDTSPKAIRELRETLTFQRFDPPSFCEPHIQSCKENPEGKIVWRRVYLPQIRDHLSLIVMRAHRAASLAHGMTESDITHGLGGKNAASENKIRRFAHTEGLVVNGLFEPVESMQHKWARRVFSEDLRQTDIRQAAEQLAIYHRTYGIEITYRSLAQVLGMSKSALYRTFDGLVGQALRLAKKKATSPTQLDASTKEHRRWHRGRTVGLF